jgi:GNAT superfamily N-acetyltransferase
MKLEKANSNDNEVLTAITKKSKAYWGYSDDQIEIWSESLTITPAYIETKSVYKLVIDAITIGYYSFFYKGEHTIKLDNLFILPEYIGKGFGRILMDDFLSLVKRTSVNKIILDSEPNAEMFYAKLGFVKVGEIDTSIKNRCLPIMELNISKKSP